MQNRCPAREQALSGATEHSSSGKEEHSCLIYQNADEGVYRLLTTALHHEQAEFTAGSHRLASGLAFGRLARSSGPPQRRPCCGCRVRPPQLVVNCRHSPLPAIAWPPAFQPPVAILAYMYTVLRLPRVCTCANLLLACRWLLHQGSTSAASWKPAQDTGPTLLAPSRTAFELAQVSTKAPAGAAVACASHDRLPIPRSRSFRVGAPPALCRRAL